MIEKYLCIGGISFLLGACLASLYWRRQFREYLRFGAELEAARTKYLKSDNSLLKTENGALREEVEIWKERAAVALRVATPDIKDRIPSKTIKFHQTYCTFLRDATCTCGKEPNYSPDKRRERGEIK